MFHVKKGQSNIKHNDTRRRPLGVVADASNVGVHLTPTRVSITFFVAKRSPPPPVIFLLESISYPGVRAGEITSVRCGRLSADNPNPYRTI